MVDVELNKMLADYLEQHVVPAYSQKLNKPYDLKYYTDGLRNGELHSHGWANLAQILYTGHILLKLNCLHFINYCTALATNGKRVLTV